MHLIIHSSIPQGTKCPAKKLRSILLYDDYVSSEAEGIKTSDLCQVIYLVQNWGSTDDFYGGYFQRHLYVLDTVLLMTIGVRLAESVTRV